MKTLKAAKGDPRILVLTNAPFVRPANLDSLALLDQAQEITGARVGRGNLLFFQRPQNHPFCLMLFNKSDGQAVIISQDGSGWDEEAMDLGPAHISDPNFWKTVKQTHKAGRDMFTLAGMSTAWAQGAPYDFLKAAEFHNHICPGLTSGYLLAHFILEQYPLAPGERYTIVGSPVWCKEDALQVILDCTAGKHGLVIKSLTATQKETISISDPAGFLLIWNTKTKTGKGVALSFNFKSFKALYPDSTPKAATLLFTIPHLKTPERFVSVATEFALDETRYNAMKQAGTNPYQIAGLMTN
jgi:formylmethanofuran dehydrogenase subunit E-like metal-binding protein